jgi:hypothetical protein
MAIDWTCPRCGSHTTLQSSNFKAVSHDVVVQTAMVNDGVRIGYTVIKCPSPKCGLLTVDVEADYYKVQEHPTGQKYIPGLAVSIAKVGPGKFRFEPRVGRPLSKYAPNVIKQDYEEACMIRDISPKAAATLCRRALQGMVRDYWVISKRTLAEELKEIEQRCDADLYGALMSLKGIGNIGAHPERDINLIIDVEPGEVDELLELLRILDAEWYVSREARKERLAGVVKLGNDKATAKNTNVRVSLAPPSAP